MRILQVLAFIGLCSKLLASAYYIPGTILSMGHETVKKKKSLWSSVGMYSFSGSWIQERKSQTLKGLNNKAINLLFSSKARILVVSECPRPVSSVERTTGKVPGWKGPMQRTQVISISPHSLHQWVGFAPQKYLSS